ncbi:MAG: prepilin-type N-terminal cleavage/methylation domain-containing protein [Planctomycetota bacterium]|jgi:prepilin-type N-terminal cleavage/methylation domain-containing protein|nr:prepilin-type N-terminal cleavage/methylation domain-containing protein [Planctomycetota bacterium]
MKRPNGFSLIEVMASLMLLAIAMILLLQIRNDSISRAAEARSLSIASRMSRQLLHRIEAARVEDLFDGYSGDFSDYGFPQFSYVVGVGDASAFANLESAEDAEEAWRLPLREDATEEDEEVKPKLTRIFITTTYPSSDPEKDTAFTLEALLPTWAVERDFELWQQLWPSNAPEAIE